MSLQAPKGLVILSVISDAPNCNTGTVTMPRNIGMGTEISRGRAVKAPRSRKYRLWAESPHPRPPCCAGGKNLSARARAGPT